MRRRRAVLVSLVVPLAASLACSRLVEDAPAPEREPSAADGQREVSATPTPQDAEPRYEVMRKICTTAPCVGHYARVTVLRDARGEVARLRYDGDLEVCSHPPRVYYDAAGAATATIPEQPVTPGSAEAEAFAAEQRGQTEGLREAETLTCFDDARCEAERVVFRSSFACRSDSDCRDCDCAPVNRGEWDRRGGPEACNIPGQECRATNPACCAGQCVLAR